MDVDEYIEEVQFISCTANAVGEEEGVSFQPFYILGGKLEACTWGGHVGCGIVVLKEGKTRETKKIDIPRCFSR
jgi:hypothetical protein